MEQIAKHSKRFEDQEMNLEIQYSFRSSLGSVENYRYCQEITGKILDTDEAGEPIAEVGSIHAYKLLIGLARNEGWEPEAVFDTENQLEKLGKKIYDFAKDDWHQAINDHFSDDAFESDVFFITQIEILPRYRGLDIGAHAIKDICNNFSESCSFVVLDCFPPQFLEGRIEDESFEKMEYYKFTNDKETAYYKLLAYFQKIGFELIPGLSPTLMFLSTLHQNEKFDQIVLE